MGIIRIRSCRGNLSTPKSHPGQTKMLSGRLLAVSHFSQPETVSRHGPADTREEVRKEGTEVGDPLLGTGTDGPLGFRWLS